MRRSEARWTSQLVKLALLEQGLACSGEAQSRGL